MDKGSLTLEYLDFRKFLFGAISGMFGLILSHPFDTIKSNIQTNNPINYNPKYLYRGISAPFIGIGIEKAIVFGIYENCFVHINKYLGSISTNFMSGAIAGLFASFVVTPYERCKILYQTNNKINMSMLRPKYLFKGLSATFTRETPGFAIYFTTYKYIESKFYNGKFTMFGSFISGGLSGALAWCFIYPQDMIKTRIQANINEKKAIIDVIKNIKMEGGLRYFYKGFHFALMRAIPLHAGTFMMMEFLKNNF